MKVILTGGTGFVGSEVLRQLADDPAVTHGDLPVKHLARATAKTR